MEPGFRFHCVGRCVVGALLFEGHAWAVLTWRVAMVHLSWRSLVVGDPAE